MKSERSFSVNQFIIGLLLVCATFNVSRAEITDPFLERTISLSATNESLESVLRKIGDRAGFTFSYSSSLFDGNKLVSVSFTNKTVREALDELFKGTINYKVRGKHIILTKAPTAKSETQVWSGYVVDNQTGERLKNVSVYEPVSLSSAITDAYGYFEIKIDKPSAEDIRLAINKQNYSDTLITVSRTKRGLLRIPVQLENKRVSALADSVGKKIKQFWITQILTPQNPNITNIQDTLYRKFQLSLVPFIGTNGALSANVINDYSVNIWGGYSRGTRKFEMGGLFNLNAGDVQHTQLAGLFNLNGGSVKGFQGAGLFNVNEGEAPTAQVAGLFNVNGSATNSTVQLAGLFTINEQQASVVQASGLSNCNGGDGEGIQLAGLINLQLGSYRGVQAAGLANWVNGINAGTQVAGLFNVARNVKGSQVGLINFSDSISGVPVGLISIVKKGYHQLEISADEIFYTNLSLRTGVRKFYNILTVGAKPNTFGDDKIFWSFGYGVGTAPKLNRWLYLNVDLIGNQLVDGNQIDAINMLNKAYIGFEVTPTKKFAIAFGVTWNGYITQSTVDQYAPLFTDLTPKILYEKTYANDINLKMWLGGKIGIRFF